LDYAARGETGFSFYSAKGDLDAALPYAELQARAMDLARVLTGFGLERYSRVAILAETTPEFPVLFFACQYAGLLPAPMSLPISLGGKESYVRRLRGLLEAADASIAVSSADLVDLLQEACDGSTVKFAISHEDLANQAKSSASRPLTTGEPAYIQYSSGSTRRPKGVLISQRAVTNNARGILHHGLEARPGDRGVSWLPLYHDMGLVGFCLTPLMSQISVDYLSTADFARRPLVWLKLFSENRGTIGFSPSFGYDLCHRRAARGAGADLDLSTWRVAGIGGDMVRADVLERFCKTFGDRGFEKKAFIPSYGLAETTLAVSFSSVEEEFETDSIDLTQYSVSGIAAPAIVDDSSQNARRFVVCGTVMPGHALEIWDDAARPLKEREVGRIVVRGPSVMDGFFNEPEVTNDVMHHDGWLDTGDLGYMIGDKLVVTGRSKDLIIINGRNIWPQDIEWAIETLDGLRSGDAAAFSVDDDAGEKVVAVVQCRLRNPEQREAMKHEIRATVRAVVGVDCEVNLARSGSIPVTSSAKLCRAATRDRYIAGEYVEPEYQTAPARAAVG
jgi:fatty-acyl-CoA synthase